MREREAPIREGRAWPRSPRHAARAALQLRAATARPRSAPRRPRAVAVGRRGSPRRLADRMPARLGTHVHYHLADARSFAGQRVLVVGLGDVAMEAAIALVAPARHRGAVVGTAAPSSSAARPATSPSCVAGSRPRAVTIAWGTEVVGLEPGQVRLEGANPPEAVPCDALLCLIGSIPADDLLRRILRPRRALALAEASP